MGSAAWLGSALLRGGLTGRGLGGRRPPLIRRALITVSDKARLEKLVPELAERGVELISSGGTAERIRRMGFKVLDVSEYTGTPEMPGGLVKTTHPKIHGGILGSVKLEDQRAYMERHGIGEIDLVVVNFYPFEEAACRRMGLEEAARWIDVGGPALARAAAKATFLHGRVTVLTSPGQYEPFLEELKRNNGDVSPAFKHKAAVQAFAYTSAYDEAVRRFLEEAVKNR